MRPEISEEDAIRTIVSEGGYADYVDVANAVKQRFGVTVGSAKVEEVVVALKQEPNRSPPSQLKHSEIHLAGGHSAKQNGPPSEAANEVAAPPNEVLRFVESMGGFDAARAAITDLEHSLKRLMQERR